MKHLTFNNLLVKMYYFYVTIPTVAMSSNPIAVNTATNQCYLSL